MTAKFETKNDVIKDFERRVHQHDAMQLFAKMRPTTASHPGPSHGHIALAALGAEGRERKPERGSCRRRLRDWVAEDIVWSLFGGETSALARSQAE